MESPPQFAIILFGVLAVCSGPLLLAGGILAYTGRWTAWVGPSGPQSTAKHSRFGFITFWGGLPLTAADILLAMEALGMDTGALWDLAEPAALFCMLLVFIHNFFLPRFLRPVLLPRWYREWEAAQFGLEEQQEAKRRANRLRRRKKLRKEKLRRAKEQARL